MAHPNSHVAFFVYESCVIEELRKIVGVPILSDWWRKQITAKGKHRAWMHYEMGLSVEQSAREIEPFATAQLVSPLPKPEHWKDGCSCFEVIR
jgi:hypothetical protein